MNQNENQGVNKPHKSEKAVGNTLNESLEAKSSAIYTFPTKESDKAAIINSCKELIGIIEDGKPLFYEGAAKSLVNELIVNNEFIEEQEKEWKLSMPKEYELQNHFPDNERMKDELVELCGRFIYGIQKNKPSLCSMTKYFLIKTLNSFQISWSVKPTEPPCKVGD